MSGEDLISVDYEVFGKVQGVFFRKYTQAEAKKLGLVGWVRTQKQELCRGSYKVNAAKWKKCKTG